MLVETLVRATAIGVVLGTAVAVAITWLTPDLSASPARAVLISGPVILAHVVPFSAIALGLLAIVAGLARFGLPAERLLSPRVLWTVGLCLLLLAVLNETARVHHVLEPWKRPLRALGGLIGFAIIVSGVIRPVRRSRRARTIERVLACGALVAFAVTSVYFGSFEIETARASTKPGMTRAPLFEPEPERLLRGAREGRPRRVIVIGLDGASWDRIHRGIDRGDLPTFARLVEGGITAPLRSVVPTYYEGGAPRRAALIGIEVGEQHAFVREAVDVGRAVALCCLSRNWTFPDPGLVCPGKGNDHEERTQEVLGRGEDGNFEAAPGGQGAGVRRL